MASQAKPVTSQTALCHTSSRAVFPHAPQSFLPTAFTARRPLNFTLTTSTSLSRPPPSSLATLQIYPFVHQNGNIRGLIGAVELEMGPQDTSILQQQYHHFPTQADVDFEAAEQLLQHSRRGRESNGDSMFGSALESGASTTNFAGLSGDRGLGDEPLDNGNEIGESHVQEQHAESQYAPINNQPLLGQVCRYALSYALPVKNCCLR